MDKLALYTHMVGRVVVVSGHTQARPYGPLCAHSRHSGALGGVPIADMSRSKMATSRSGGPDLETSWRSCRDVALDLAHQNLNLP